MKIASHYEGMLWVAPSEHHKAPSVEICHPLYPLVLRLEQYYAVAISALTPHMITLLQEGQTFCRNEYEALE